MPKQQALGGDLWHLARPAMQHCPACQAVVLTQVCLRDHTWRELDPPQEPVFGTPHTAARCQTRRQAQPHARNPGVDWAKDDNYVQ